MANCCSFSSGPDGESRVAAAFMRDGWRAACWLPGRWSTAILMAVGCRAADSGHRSKLASNSPRSFRSGGQVRAYSP
eukprot:scaffold142667_cov127-Phaeocystis_antarctica.AAC.1